jgi:uncharacterized membrane protein YhiD involved in acid resistance
MEYLNYKKHLTACTVVVLLTGLLLSYLIGGRRFNRRNVAGLQCCKSYSAALFTVTVEKVLNILASLMIAGAILIYFIT